MIANQKQRGRSCALCAKVDEERDWAILIGGASFDELAVLTGASKSAVHRHLSHITVTADRAVAFRTWAQQRAQRQPGAALERKLARLDEAEEAEAPSPGQIFHRLYALEGEALGLLHRAKEQDQVRDAVAAIRASESLLVRISELSGLLGPASQVNLAVMNGAPDGYDFGEAVRRMRDALITQVDEDGHDLIYQADQALRHLSEADPDGYPADVRRRVDQVALWAQRFLDHYGIPAEQTGGWLPAGSPYAKDAEDAVVVDASTGRVGPSAPPLRALPAPHSDGCRCFSCKDREMPSGGVPGPMGVCR